MVAGCSCLASCLVAVLPAVSSTGCLGGKGPKRVEGNECNRYAKDCQSGAPASIASRTRRRVCVWDRTRLQLACSGVFSSPVATLGFACRICDDKAGVDMKDQMRQREQASMETYRDGKTCELDMRVVSVVRHAVDSSRPRQSARHGELPACGGLQRGWRWRRLLLPCPAARGMDQRDSRRVKGGFSCSRH